MNGTAFVRRLASCVLFVVPHLGIAAMPSHPAGDRDFHLLPDGTDLRNLRVSGVRLSLTRGAGGAFTVSARTAYEKLKSESMSRPGHPVQWTFMDLDSRRVIAESLESNRKIFGASSSKVFVAGAMLARQQGLLRSAQKQLMADMLVVSSNSAWTNLQSQIGGGDANKGRERIHAFTQGLGYQRTRGFQGYWGTMHGNELTAAESAQYLSDIYWGVFEGAETLWKLMHACRTGVSRGLKYIPASIYVGGKTGTYDGPTENPETGRTTNPDGSAYRVAVRNHLLVFNVGGREYGLAVLADTGSDESAALLAGGLLREYTGYQPPASK